MIIEGRRYAEDWEHAYKEWQDRFLRYPVENFVDEAQRMTSITYYLSGFVAEAGECLGELVKAMGQQKTAEIAIKELTTSEMGDALFFFIAALRCMDTDLDAVATNNIIKLNNRYGVSTNE